MTLLSLQAGKSDINIIAISRPIPDIMDTFDDHFFPRDGISKAR